MPSEMLWICGVLVTALGTLVYALAAPAKPSARLAAGEFTTGKFGAPVGKKQPQTQA